MSKRIIIPKCQSHNSDDSIPETDIEALYNFEETVLNGIKSFTLAYWQLLKLEEKLPDLNQAPEVKSVDRKNKEFEKLDVI